MAEKQDQMEEKMDFAQFNMLGNTQDQQVESNPSYYHTLIITDQAGTSTEWQTTDQKKVTMPQAFQEFTLGETTLLELLIVYASGTVPFLRVMPSYWICPKIKQDSLPIGVWRKAKTSTSMIPLVNITGSLQALGSTALELTNKDSFSFILMERRLTHEPEQSYTIPSDVKQFS